MYSVTHKIMVFHLNLEWPNDIKKKLLMDK